MHLEDVLSIHSELFRVQALGFLRPSDGKRVRCEESNGWHVEISMLTWLEGPWTGHFDGDSAGVSWESLNQCLASSIAKVSVEKFYNARGPLKPPDSNDTVKELELRNTCNLKMIPDGNDDKNNGCDVNVLESLVKGVTKNRTSLDRDENEGDHTLLMLAYFQR